MPYCSPDTRLALFTDTLTHPKQFDFMFIQLQLSKERTMNKRILIMALLVAFFASTTACKKEEGTMEKMGKKLDQTAHKVEKASEDAAHDVEKAAKDAAEKVKDGN